ncbi:Alpha/Beta hydrolase protein, partial [Dimargaris cristalligena]
CAKVADSTLVGNFQSKNKRAVGYVAINNDIKSVSMVFRGTDNINQYLTDLQIKKKDWPDWAKDSAVHTGFLEAYESVSDSLYTQVTGQLAKHPSHNLTISGHSLGAALASLAAVDFVHRNKTLANIMRVVTFGKPRVGNQEYADHYNSLDLDSLFVVNKDDIVPHLPPKTLGYRHENGENWIKPDSNSNTTISCPQVDNDANPNCSASVKFRNLSRKDHHWAWNVEM